MVMDLIVSRAGGIWRARFGGQAWRCAIGRGAARLDKREGDGATPAGCWPLRRVLYRADRLTAPETALPLAEIGPRDGWCDDPADSRYNRPVALPCGARHEKLWRADRVYDLVVVLGHNDDPPVAGAGSAVFLHLARPGYAPTEGCVALALDDLLSFLGVAAPDSRLCVEAD